MDTLFAIAVVGAWIAISVVGLKRAYVSRGPSCPKPTRSPTGTSATTAPGRGR
jgi:hypothetical protein